MGDWHLAKRLLRYLKGAKNQRTQLKGIDMSEGDALQLESYTDVDFAGDGTDCKSVNVVIYRVNDMIVGSLCKKQSAVAMSTLETN